MFLARLIRITLIAVISITAYLPVTLNPKIFVPRTKCINVINYLVWGERNPKDSVSYIATDYNIASAIDY